MHDLDQTPGASPQVLGSAAQHEPGLEVAVLGTGALGAAIVRRLCVRGHHVRVWNRTRSRAEPLRAAGAVVAGSPAEAARGAGVLLTVLADGPAVAEQAAQALDELRDGAIWVQTATVGVGPLGELAGLAGQHDVPLLDCPVSGSPDDAEHGRLTVLASGPGAAIDVVMPVLADLGRQVLRTGGVGTATHLKLAINSWLMALLEGTAEAVALAEALGLDGALLADALAGGPLDFPWMQSVVRSMAGSDFASGGSLALALKDVRLAREVIEAQGLDLPLSGLVAGRLARAAAAGATVQQQLVDVSRA